MCLEQHFLSNSGIKIPRSRACDRHCWSWYYPPGWQCSPAARPVRWTAIAPAFVRDRIPLEAGSRPRAGGGLCMALPRRGEQSGPDRFKGVQKRMLTPSGAPFLFGVRGQAKIRRVLKTVLGRAGLVGGHDCRVPVSFSAGLQLQVSLLFPGCVRGGLAGASLHERARGFPIPQGPAVS